MQLINKVPWICKKEQTRSTKPDVLLILKSITIFIHISIERSRLVYKEITKYYFWRKAKTFKVGIGPGNRGMAFSSQHFQDITACVSNMGKEPEVYVFVFLTSRSQIKRLQDNIYLENYFRCCWIGCLLDISPTVDQRPSFFSSTVKCWQKKKRSLLVLDAVSPIFVWRIQLISSEHKKIIHTQDVMTRILYINWMLASNAMRLKTSRKGRSLVGLAAIYHNALL